MYLFQRPAAFHKRYVENTFTPVDITHLIHVWTSYKTFMENLMPEGVSTKKSKLIS